MGIILFQLGCLSVPYFKTSIPYCSILSCLFAACLEMPEFLKFTHLSENFAVLKKIHSVENDRK